MGLFGNRAVERSAAPPRVPRDIEALEELVTNLESATDEASTWRIWASTYAEFYDMDYAAAWLVESGAPRLEYELGRIAPALAGIADRPSLVQKAIQARQPISGDETGAATDPRLAAAIRAGARAALAFPVMNHGTITAVLEFYTGTDFAIDGPLISKWAAIGRLAEQARSPRWPPFQIRQLADDRLAVTTVVSALGRHQRLCGRRCASALDAVRTAFHWAYGSYWELDERRERPAVPGRVRLGRRGVPQGHAGRHVRRGGRAVRPGLAGSATWSSSATSASSPTACGRPPRNAPAYGPASASRSSAATASSAPWTSSPPSSSSFSESRASALRNVQQLVSQRLDIVRATRRSRRPTRGPCSTP